MTDLPSLPSVAMEVMKRVSDPNTGVIDLVEAIQVDVGLTGRLLRTANSAYYGVPRKIDSLRMALMVIGMEEISSIVTAASVMKMFSPKQDGPKLDIPAFWLHSASVAELTLGLYEFVAMPKPTGAYVAGLLHDIGVLVLHQNFPDLRAATLKLVSDGRLASARAEVEIIGVDHGHIGAWLIQRWNLPEEIINGVAQHHIRPQDISIYSLPAMIDRADSLFYMLQSNPAEVAVNTIRDSESWQEWISSRGSTIPVLVEKAQKRLERASSLLEALH